MTSVSADGGLCVLRRRVGGSGRKGDYRSHGGTLETLITDCGCLATLIFGL